MKKTKKIIAVLIIAIMLLVSLTGIVNADTNNGIKLSAEQLQTIIKAKDMTSTKFSPYFLLQVYVTDTLMGNPEYADILLKDIAEKQGILKMYFENEPNDTGDIDALDATFLTVLANIQKGLPAKTETEQVCYKALTQGIIKKHNIKDEDLEIITKVEIPDTLFDIIESKFNVDLEGIKVFGGKSNEITVSSKTTTAEQSAQMWTDLGKFVQNFDEEVKDDLERAKIVAQAYILVSTQVKAQVGNEIITYTLTLGKDKNWYLVPDKLPTPEDENKEFSTEISYSAKIDGKDVGQNTKYKEENKIDNSVFCPGFDEKQPAKDADVTVTINSKTDLPILQTNGVALKDDGTANSEGWYYVDVNNKKVIAKVYKFEDYNNLEDNGIVKEDIILASEDDLSDEQKVAITWPFRITDVTYDPAEITEKTEKVTVTVTTNLPMDKDKLPDGWNFTTDDEGKTQHKISKVYEKKDGKNIDENVVVKQNGTDVTDSTLVKITWKEQLPKKIAQTGGTLTIAGIIVILTICSVVSFKKYRK